MSSKEGYHTSPENNQNETLQFYGDESLYDLLTSGQKLVTIRKPSKYDHLQPGQEISAVIKNPEFNLLFDLSTELIVIDVIQKPLDQYHSFELELDGYDSPKAAARDLRQYYGRINTRRNPMQAIFFMPKVIFDELPHTQQQEIISSDVLSLAKKEKYRHIFFSALARMKLESQGDFGSYDWFKHLKVLGLVTQQEVDHLMKENSLEMRAYNMPHKMKQLIENPDPEKEVFRNIILIQEGKTYLDDNHPEKPNHIDVF